MALNRPPSGVRTPAAPWIDPHPREPPQPGTVRLPSEAGNADWRVAPLWIPQGGSTPNGTERAGSWELVDHASIRGWGKTATWRLVTSPLSKSLPSKEVIGLKILDFTKGGPAAIRDLFGTIADTLPEPHLSHENAHLITSTLIRHVDWKKLAQVAA